MTHATTTMTQDFEIEDLGTLIGDTLGHGAKVLFCVGLYAAAYSSAITCPLGSALTAQQVNRHLALPPPQHQRCTHLIFKQGGPEGHWYFTRC